MSESKREQKDYCYIKDGKILKESEGLTAKAEKEAKELYEEIKQLEKQQEDSKNENDNKDENEDILTKVVDVFKKGPLKWKPNFDTKRKSHFKSNRKVDDFEEKEDIMTQRENAKQSNETTERIYAGKAELSLVNTTLAEAHYAAKLETSKTSYSCEMEEMQTKDSKTTKRHTASVEGELKADMTAGCGVGTAKYKLLKSNVKGTFSTEGRLYYCEREETQAKDSKTMKRYAASAEGGLKADMTADGEVGIDGYKLKSDIKSSFSTKGKADFLGEEKSKHVIGKETRYHYKAGHASAKGEMKLDAEGTMKLEMGKRKVSAEGEIRGQASGEARFKALDIQSSKSPDGIEAKAKLLHGKAEGSAKFEAKGKFGDKTVKAEGTATGKASFKLADGKMILKMKKEDGRIFIPGANLTLGQAKVKANMEMNLNGKEIKAKTKASVSGVKVNALSLDIRRKKDYGTRNSATAAATGIEANVANARITGKKEGKIRGVQIKASGAKFNALNAKLTGIDNREKSVMKVEVGGPSVSALNLDAQALGSKGKEVNVDAGVGVKCFNVSIGVRRDTGVSVSTKFSFCNLNLTLGPPRLNFNPGFLNFGIPFFSGGGGGASGGGDSERSHKDIHENGNTGNGKDGGDKELSGKGDEETSNSNITKNDVVNGRNYSGRANFDWRGDCNIINNRNKEDIGHFQTEEIEKEDTKYSLENAPSSVYQTSELNFRGIANSDSSISAPKESSCSSKHEASVGLETKAYTQSQDLLQGNVIDNFSLDSDGNLIPSEDEYVIIIDNPDPAAVDGIASHFGATEFQDGESVTAKCLTAKMCDISSAEQIRKGYTANPEHNLDWDRQNCRTITSHPKESGVGKRLFAATPGAIENREDPHSIENPEWPVWSGKDKYGQNASSFDGSSSRKGHADLYANTCRSRMDNDTGYSPVGQQENEVRYTSQNSTQRVKQSRRNEVRNDLHFQNIDQPPTPSQGSMRQAIALSSDIPNKPARTNLKDSASYNKHLFELISKKMSSGSTPEVKKTSREKSEKELDWSDKEKAKEAFYRSRGLPLVSKTSSNRPNSTNKSSTSGHKPDRSTGMKAEGESQSVRKPEKKTTSKKPFGEKAEPRYSSHQNKTY